MASCRQMHRGNTAHYCNTFPILAAHFCPSALPQCPCWTSSWVFVATRTTLWGNDNDKTINSEARKKVLKLLLVRWVLAPIWFLTQTLVLAQKHLRGRKALQAFWHCCQKVTRQALLSSTSNNCLTCLSHSPSGSLWVLHLRQDVLFVPKSCKVCGT